QVPSGPITEQGLRMNIDIGLGYIEAWLRGIGCVPLHHLMEDAATAEISRAQVWQWLRHGAKLEDGRTIDRALVERIIGEERDRAAAKATAHRFDDAARLFQQQVTATDFVEFLTLPAYELVDWGGAGRPSAVGRWISHSLPPCYLLARAKGGAGMSEPVRVEQRGHVLEVTLDRPK